MFSNWKSSHSRWVISPARTDATGHMSESPRPCFGRPGYTFRVASLSAQGPKLKIPLSSFPRSMECTYTSFIDFSREMCGNGFQHSHSLPFPSIQFPFPPTPIPKFLTYSDSHGIPVWAISIPSYSHSVNAKVVYNQWYGNDYNMFLITEILIIYYHYTKNVHILV